ncbi:MAG: cytochrome c oxidase assembly protein [bacterium]|jgi:cytochrome c oxidase assembly protein subunit 11
MTAGDGKAPVSPAGPDARVDETAADNRVTLRKLLVVTVMMFGFGFALVPLYEKLCEVTGINRIVKRDDHKPANTQVDSSRSITVEFDANLRSNLPWTFKPLETSVKVHPGEIATVIYEVTNVAGKAVTGQAIPSYGPMLAGQFFRKIECFCFEKQELAAGETRQMPIAFVVDPTLPSDVNTITLSFTFFEVAGRAQAEPPLAAAATPATVAAPRSKIQ